MYFLHCEHLRLKLDKHSSNCFNQEINKDAATVTRTTRSILKKAVSADHATIMRIKEQMSAECFGSKDDTELKASSSDINVTSTQKNVTFADDKNHNLVEIRNFVPSSENMDLFAQCDFFQNQKPENRPSITLVKPERTPAKLKPELVLRFDDPCSDKSFREKFERRFVALEKCGVRDRTITGIILVKNIEFGKAVFVRYTIDKWTSHSDTEAMYIPNSTDGLTDRFAFSLNMPKSSLELEFAICYKLPATEYWDNNENRNYKIHDVLHQAAVDS